jgi:hypothetical protein
MKKFVISSLIAASAVALSAGAASAQPWREHDNGRWMSINERQRNLDMRIERGVQRGDLTPREAMRLRRESDQIARLEYRYRANGLSNWERRDLDRRFDQLSAQVRYERRDDQYGYGYGNDRYGR